MKFLEMQLPLAVLVLLGWIEAVLGANILAVLPLDIPSHHRFGEPILKELAARGHKVTVLTPIEDANPTQNYRTILLPRKKLWDAVSPGENNTMLSPKTNSFINSQSTLRNHTLVLTDFILRSQPMRDLLLDESQKFDLIVCELFHIRPFFMLSHVYGGVPIVALSAFGHGHFINQQMGNPYELAYASHENLDLPVRYGFWDRLRNTFWTMVDLFERDMWSAEHDDLTRRHFSTAQEGEDSGLPSLKDVEKNISLVLVNAHFSTDTVRPNVPGVVEVGGLHIGAARALPKNVQKFLDESKDGAVYVNFESDVLKSEVSKVTLSKVFGADPKQRFIWQRDEDDDVFDRIDNVLIVKGLRQSDVLAHANVKLFITHGGQLSVQDSVARGVPMLCSPLYGDQFSSCELASHRGHARRLNAEDLTVETLSSTVRDMLSCPSYKASALRVASAFNDRLDRPLHAAVYWVEYVLGHDEGAKQHLRSPAADLAWHERHLVDSVGVIVAIFSFIIWGLNWMFWNVALRKKIPRDDIQHLIEKQKEKAH